MLARGKLSATSSFVRRSLRSTVVASSQLRLSSTAEPSPNATVHPDPEGWHEAKPFKSIPGPGKFQLLRSFLPGGEFYNISFVEVHRIMHDRYGTLCRFPGLFGKPDMVLSFDPSHFETVYRTEGIWPKRMALDSFKHYRTQIRPDVYKGMGGLVSDQGETWYRMRKATNPIMMSPKIVKSYVASVDAVTRDFIGTVAAHRVDNDDMPATFGNDLNLWSLESIGSIALDRRLGVLSPDRGPEADLLIRTVKDFFRLSASIELKPAIWKYYETSEFKQLMQTFDNMTNLTLHYVDESLKMLEASDASGEASDRSADVSVMQKLLRTNRDYAIMMTIDMLFAGIDTTSTTVANLLYLLAINPAVQERLRTEVFAVLPDCETPFAQNAIDEMPFMRACIKESMRINPIVQGHLRSTGQNLIFEGYQIPKNTDFAMAPSLLLKNDDYFRNASEFRPERWLRDSSATDKPLHPFGFLPFGFGPRSCIGRRFAEMEIQILVARLLRNYRIEWHHGPLQHVNLLITVPSSELRYRMLPL